MTDLTSIGTLFAFVLVCGGLLRLNPRGETPQGKFQTPYINAKWIFPVILIICVVAAMHFNPDGVHQFFSSVDPSQPGVQGWDVFKHKIPLGVFMVTMLVLGVQTFVYDLSLIPVLGVATSGYLMTELGITNWLRFGIWLVVGLFFYFIYGVKHSRYRPREAKGLE